jgi:hypothetical protein
VKGTVIAETEQIKFEALTLHHLHIGQAALSSQAQRLNSIRLCRAADLYVVVSFAVQTKRLWARTRRAAKASVLCSEM